MHYKAWELNPLGFTPGCFILIYFFPQITSHKTLQKNYFFFLALRTEFLIITMLFFQRKTLITCQQGFREETLECVGSIKSLKLKSVE